MGCNRGSNVEGPASAADRRNVPQPLVRRECKGERAQTVDANGDGKPDIQHYFTGNVRVCSEIDMNFDGRVDVARFYAQDGTTVAFEQHDFDFDGKLDEQARFEGGQLKSKELDTNFDGIIDTWLWCNGPYVERAERARRKVGKVDTLEVYENGLIREIQYDEDHNGKIEKWEIYQNGKLVELKYDTDFDGNPDRTEPIVSEYDKDEPVSCDGSPLVEPAPAAAPAPEPGTLTESEKQLLEDTGQDPETTTPESTGADTSGQQ